MRIILASQSPRRKELFNKVLEQTSFASDFEIHKPEIEEKRSDKESAVDYVNRLTLEKALHILGQLQTELTTPFLILSADTIVVHKDQLLEKPADRAHAESMLNALNNSTHNVMTGFCLLYSDQTPQGAWSRLENHPVENLFVFQDIVTTSVTFKAIPNAWIQIYLDSDEPYDKAGAYGIQGSIGKWVLKTQGSFDNVVGLPTEKIHSILTELA